MICKLTEGLNLFFVKIGIFEIPFIMGTLYNRNGTIYSIFLIGTMQLRC